MPDWLSCPRIDLEIASDLSCDRLVSNFVLDLLSPDDIHAVIAEAHCLLVPNGLSCLSGLGHGTTLLCRLVSGTWKTVPSVFPRLVGGWRPVEILEFVEEPTWRILHNKVVTPYFISSEIVVAEKRAA